jgi:hypothetical protein
MVLNRADECRQRADDCRRGTAQVTDDVLRVTYLDLARRWRIMAHEAESLERKAIGPKTNTPHSRTGVRFQRFMGGTRPA